MKKYIALVTVVILSIACGQSLPQEPNTPQAKVSNPMTQEVGQMTQEVGQVVTLDRLNIRPCPSTDDAVCPPLSSYAEGEVVTVGAMVQNTDPNCPRWYTVQWDGRSAWVCAEWTSK